MIASTQHLGAGRPADEASDHLDPAQDLYAHAAGVLAAAQAVDAASHAPGAVAAVAPTLACLETSLASLAAATDRLRAQAVGRLADPLFEDDELRRHRSELAANLERLSGVLTQASRAAELSLSAAVPVLDELTV